ncbi:MAG: hypothetical protein HY883_02830 [Deltaproteobacteria bacterium]|nr:hypothetical protein [Deltaproteobacteria bacterium]
MGWNPLTSNEIQVKQPTRQELWQKIKDNLDYLYGTMSPGGRLQNGSFEVDSDSDGIPDGWTQSLYPGGSGAYETMAPAHGAKAYKFTHPGGANNGGGYLESDYIEISDTNVPMVDFMIKCSAAGMKNIVRLRYFDKAKAFLSSEDVYSSTSNPTSWSRFFALGTPPASARYIKIDLISGYTDTNVAGTITWDMVEVSAAWSLAIKSTVTLDFPEKNPGTASYVDLSSISLWVPPWAATLVARVRIKNDNASDTTYARLKIGSDLSDEASTSGTGSWENGTLTLNISSGNRNTVVTLVLQGKRTASVASIHKTRDANDASGAVDYAPASYFSA